MLIWWINQQDCETITKLIGEEGVAPNPWPEYLRNQYASRYGRAGRARLWVDFKFGFVKIDENDLVWSTPVGAMIEARYGGIVIREDDLPHVATYPGFVTTLKLEPLTIEVNVVE